MRPEADAVIVSIRRRSILPMTATATPIAATTEQQHKNNDNEDQFHSKSPVR
jgi:hypothetical protein